VDLKTKTDLTIHIVQEEWLQEILVDPIAKSPLYKEAAAYIALNSFVYSIKENIPDLRIKLNDFEREWQQGQAFYEQWMLKYLNHAEVNAGFYPAEQKRDAPMYQRLTLDGRVLDVGGNLGFIRKYMADDQQYCSIDPFLNLCKLAEGKTNLFSYYPMHKPLNFLGGFAEFLPLQTGSFQTVNMRSCIDHFFNPNLALLEANRVLSPKGKLIIGMTVDVDSLKNKTKEFARSILNIFTNRFQDKHIWHPSRIELIAMCKTCGFELEDEVWQDENVWYASFRKTVSRCIVT